MALLSVLVIGLTYLVCDFLRRQCQRQMSPGFTKNTILDLLVSLELCIGAFELGVILDNYGIFTWSLGLMTTVIYQVLRWKDLEGPSPGVHFQEYLEGKKSLQDVFVRSAILVVSGLLAYR